MSALKDQLRLILPELSKESNANQQPEIKRHLYLIKAVCASTKSVKQVCESRGVSTDQFYHWGTLLKKFKNLECLKSKSKKPTRSPNQTSKHIERKILVLRKAEPSHGAERISFDLKRLFKIICAPMTVYNVLKRLKLISADYHKKLTKKHHRRYRRPFAGYMQMDIKYVPYRINGKQFYEFNIVDHCTTWRYIRIYQNITHANIKLFLKGIEENCPFPIEEIQTDNGQEFTDKYRHGLVAPSGQHVLDQWCKERNIVHRLIPIGQKELNGKVENTHKQDDREFYAGKPAVSFENLERAMRGYNGRWNEIRATKSLGWKTPNQCVEASVVRAMVYLKLMVEKYPHGQQPIYRYDQNGNAIMTVPKDVTVPSRKIKIKKPTAVDRYMQWHDNDQKKTYKAFLPALPVMSQIFPKLVYSVT
jgi:transposase InsO family protein